MMIIGFFFIVFCVNEINLRIWEMVWVFFEVRLCVGVVSWIIWGLNLVCLVNKEF